VPRHNQDENFSPGLSLYRPGSPKSPSGNIMRARRLRLLPGRRRRTRAEMSRQRSPITCSSLVASNLLMPTSTPMTSDGKIYDLDRIVCLRNYLAQL
jgi:hypothetical protein